MTKSGKNKYLKFLLTQISTRAKTLLKTTFSKSRFFETKKVKNTPRQLGEEILENSKKVKFWKSLTKELNLSFRIELEQKREIKIKKFSFENSLKKNQ